VQDEFYHQIKNNFEVYIVWEPSYNDYFVKFILLPSQTNLSNKYPWLL